MRKNLKYSKLQNMLIYSFLTVRRPTPELHKEYTGVDNKVILENLEALSDAGNKIILRCPIIPGFNDRAEHSKGISEIADKFSGIEHIEIKPFHPLGESKYSALGRKYANIKTPDTETIRRWKETVER